MTTAPSIAGEENVQVFDSAARPHPMVEEVFELWRFRDLVRQWCGRNLKLRYKRSFFGVIWTLGEPLLIMSILALVFSQAFRFPVERFPIYLLSGLLVFDFFNRTTIQIIDEMLESSSLTQRIHVPRSAFAVASLLAHLVNWAAACVPLAALMLVFGSPVSTALIALPAIMLLAAMFTLGIGLLVATVGAFFHDIKITYQVLLTGLFYATPIFWPVEIVPASFERYLAFNPLLHFVALFRRPVYEGSWPTSSQWLICSGLAAGALLIGWWVFSKSRDVLSRNS